MNAGDKFAAFTLIVMFAAPIGAAGFNMSYYSESPANYSKYLWIAISCFLLLSLMSLIVTFISQINVAKRFFFCNFGLMLLPALMLATMELVHPGKKTQEKMVVIQLFSMLFAAILVFFIFVSLMLFFI